jgi:hypothetical protein
VTEEQQRWRQFWITAQTGVMIWMRMASFGTSIKHLHMLGWTPETLVGQARRRDHRRVDQGEATADGGFSLAAWLAMNAPADAPPDTLYVEGEICNVLTIRCWWRHLCHHCWMSTAH